MCKTIKKTKTKNRTFQLCWADKKTLKTKSKDKVKTGHFYLGRSQTFESSVDTECRPQIVMSALAQLEMSALAIFGHA
jgi:hypothetical protein